ncbi:MAG: DUF1963 domain-containing protein [Ruminococcus sp.]|nr:DUF1963 domain-containing protein [Ruminococcus sp.]
MEDKLCVKIKLTDTKPSIFESKAGGIGYIPHDGDFPTDKNGEQLRLLAQIDCSEVDLEEFPEKGLLQFWVINDDTAGLADGQTVQDGFRVIYYPEIDKSVTEEEIKGKFVKNQYDDDEYNGFPVFGEYGMTFTKMVNNSTNDKGDYDKYYDEYIGHKIGGYPYFTQFDPRECYEELQKYDFLLFQLDSDYGENDDRVMWGDSGIGNFFIKTENLKNCDFSDVLYNWDCC